MGKPPQSGRLTQQVSARETAVADDCPAARDKFTGQVDALVRTGCQRPAIAVGSGAYACGISCAGQRFEHRLARQRIARDTLSPLAAMARHFGSVDPHQPDPFLAAAKRIAIGHRERRAYKVPRLSQRRRQRKRRRLQRRQRLLLDGRSPRKGEGRGANEHDTRCGQDEGGNDSSCLLFLPPAPAAAASCHGLPPKSACHQGRGSGAGRDRRA